MFTVIVVCAIVLPALALGLAARDLRPPQKAYRRVRSARGR